MIMATIKSLSQIPSLLLYGWFLSIVMLLIFPYVGDTVMWKLYAMEMVQDVGGQWAEVTQGEMVYNIMYLVCFLPGGMGTAAALYQSTRKQQYRDVVDYQEIANENPYSTAEEY